jgi:putative acetyltransferase
MDIRNATAKDRSSILRLHRKAFGDQQGPEVETLVDNLFDDRTAEPRYSFVAVEGDMVVGHILFTAVEIVGASKDLTAQLLAPLAVLPPYWNKGIGGRLIQTGLQELRQHTVKLVFVLGHPGYYPRYGFTPAGKHGFTAPYPIPEELSGAWMVQELFPGIIGTEKGEVQCSAVLNRPEHWRE